MLNELNIRNSYPRLNDRALGWLRFLHRKATTKDDWSEDGTPHPWWDRYSNEPTLSFARFDLSESSYAIGLMSDQTPAWQEIYARILGELAQRHLTFWAAYDWLTQFGTDPRRKSYPDEWVFLFIPEHLVGEYDTPGWVANGVEPWGLQPDPIGADGNLFFKGWLNLIQSLHAYVSGEDEWGQSFQVAGVDKARFEWTQHRLVEHLTKQWSDNPIGPHCENTKIWPYCLSAAGLGLQLYGKIFNKDSHAVYHNWLKDTKSRFFGVDKNDALEWTTFYYDPLIDHLQTAPPSFGLAIGFYMMPQEPVFAEFLYRASTRFMQWDNPQTPIMDMPDPRLLVLGLTLAKEFGDAVVYTRLRDYVENHFEPRFFGDDGGEFGFWFHFGEEWPRGQLSALAMIAEVGTQGAWRQLFENPNLDKFHEPAIEGVDYPALSIAQAYNDKQAGFLQTTLFSGNSGQKGQKTHFHVKNLPDSQKVKIMCDGSEYEQWSIIDQTNIKIETTMDNHSFQIYSGYHGQTRQKSDNISQAQKPPKPSHSAKAQKSQKLWLPKTSRLNPLALKSSPSYCPCCAPSATSSLLTR